MEILYSGVSWFDYTSCELLVLASLHPFETSVSDYGVTKTMTHLERHFSFEQNIYCMRSKKLKHCLVHSYFYFADISFVYLERICPYGEKYLGTGYYIFHCNFHGTFYSQNTNDNSYVIKCRAMCAWENDDEDVKLTVWINLFDKNVPQ